MHLPHSRRRFLHQSAFAASALYAGRLFGQGAALTPTVETQYGPLRGLAVEGTRIFRGIPFAQPPVGRLRYRAPVKPQRWSAARDATRFSAAPMQTGEGSVEHGEDCLYLNVWAPEGNGPFPVFVWIHGGGFTNGNAFEPVYDGAKFARDGIICITVAYRLGVFGFLDLAPVLGPEYAGSANNALRDLIAALEWVRGNVAAFGGDPNQVTVGGESAGAKLTDILMGIPAAQPLFHQMISESGGAERVGAEAVAAAVANGFAKAWASASGPAAESLLTGDAAKIIQVQKEFLDTWPQHFPLRAELDPSLIPRLLIDAIAAGSSRGKRLLIGTNRDESALFVGPSPAHDATAKDLGNMPVDRFDAVYSHYKGVYPEMSDEQLRIRALTAEEYWIPTIRVADAHVKNGGAAWMYQLDFTETSGRLKGEAYHSLDVGLVWDKPHLTVDNAATEAALAIQVHAAWSAFIRGQAPSAPGLPAWPQYQAADRSTMMLNMQSRVEQRPQEAELRLWDHLL